MAVLTLNNGRLTRTKKFQPPDYFYTTSQVDLWEVDELIILDATRGGDPGFLKAASEICDGCFVPTTLGGGIRKLDDVKRYFDAGADKVSVNTGACENPRLVTDIAEKYGAQAIVLSIDVDGGCFNDCGRKKTGSTPVAWGQRGESLGAGEILLNSIPRDGSLSGYDLELCKSVCDAVRIPVIILGGAGSWKHFEQGFAAGASACATQNIYHFTRPSILAAKQYLSERGIPVRI